ncbi:MAG: hypothetical protein KIS67_14370 [Verrucomicrobiae bacterium]|nr:hypothetical protein [Verrucomicrobiae bacterium]
MQPAKKLTRSLRKLADLLEREAARNPAFADELAIVLGEALRSEGGGKRKPMGTEPERDIPDVFQTLEKVGETEFRFWLRGLDTQTLKLIIKANGFDPAKTSARWSDNDKFVELVAEQAVARMQRGSAFLAPRAKPQQPSE